MRGDSVDLAAVAFAIEADANLRDACGGQGIEDDTFVNAVRFGGSGVEIARPFGLKVFAAGHDVPLLFE